MNKTLNINLAGFIFHIDDNAFLKLENYLNALKSQFRSIEGGSEIISDIEMRIAELFRERVSDDKEVITSKDVEEVIAIMGQPEDYLDPEAAAQASPPSGGESGFRRKRIFRDPDNRMVGGVAAGLGAYFNIDPLWVRLLFIVLLFFGFGFLIYLVLWLVIPKAQTTAEKLQMRGESVNISNIERAIREELHGVNEGVKGFAKRAGSYDYSRPTSQLTGFFNDLGNFIVEALKLIFRFLGKLIGLFLLFIGFVFLMALVVGFFAGSIQIMGSDYSFGDVFEFLKIVTASNGHYNMLLLGIVLTVIAPFFLLIYLGMRILFNLDPLNRPTRDALTLTTFIGLVLLVVSCVKIGLQFDSDADMTRELALNNAGNHYIVRIQQDSLFRSYENDHHLPWRNLENENTFDIVGFNILKSESDRAYLKITTHSQGYDRRDARLHASQVSYEVDIHDSIIELPTYYSLGKGQKFRAQEVTVTLYLPAGSSAFLDQSTANILDDVQNLQNEWDYHMVDKNWIMTKEGLSCENCAIPQSHQNTEEIDSNQIEIDSLNEIEIKAGDKQLRIRLKEGNNQKEVKLSALEACLSQKGGNSLELMRTDLNTVI